MLFSFLSVIFPTFRRKWNYPSDSGTVAVLKPLLADLGDNSATPVWIYTSVLD